MGHDPDNWSRHDRISVDGLPPLRFNVTNLISKGEACLNPQTWPETLARPRLRAHPIILQWYKFYGSFLWYPILSLQQRFPFLSFFHNRILRGEYKFENKFLMKFESRVIQSMTKAFVLNMWSRRITFLIFSPMKENDISYIRKESTVKD